MTVTGLAATLVPGPVQPRDGDRFAAWLADINWAKLFPEGRNLYYEGEHPEEFAEAVREEFGFDPSGDPFRPAARGVRTAGLFIGPEGGWEDAELETARGLGMRMTSLGKLVLSAQTAAVVATYLVVHGAGM